MSESNPIAAVVSPGVGLTAQDAGRRGWRRYGVPESGAMDQYSMRWANRLLGNSDRLPVLEFAFQGGELRFLKNVWVACCGADLGCNVTLWSAYLAKEGTVLRFSRNVQGVYSYVAVAGGWLCDSWLGSCSVNARAGIGKSLGKGDFLYGNSLGKTNRFPGISKRVLLPEKQRIFDGTKKIRVFPGPQFEYFEDAFQFVSTAWKISSRSDRSGYRLDGGTVQINKTIESEATLPGSVQVTPSGQPIVTLNDGPTVGGYPKIAIIHPEDLSWFVQCGPAVEVKFEWVD